MKVKVYAPSFCDHSSLDDANMMELPENSTVRDVYRKLRIPLIYRPIIACAVNHKVEKRSKKLQDGDVVSFLSIMSGG